MDEIFDPFEDVPWLSMRAILVREGFTPLRPAEVDDYQLRGRLWELIYALAAWRTYLSCSDHLSERALYEWLDRFLDEDTADCPPESEWNHRVDVSEAGSGTDEGRLLWLRYYLSLEEREQWAREFPEDEMPPCERLPFDRDRFLPEPPMPRGGYWVPPEKEEDDPLGLAAVDREIAAAAEEEAITESQRVEEAGWQRPIDQLKSTAADPIPPDELTDETLTAKLWELLHNLSCRGFYVLCTDHLSDRALYAALWTRGLRDAALLPGRSRTAAWFHDFLGECSDEDIQLRLRYYASDEERARHAREGRSIPLPPHEPRPFRRDWRLPKGPF